jgi:tetratricopeptide (TPR) repeat protein
MNILIPIEKWLEIFYRVSLIIVLVAVFISALLSFLDLRKKIIFKAWINRFDESDKELGKSIGDLLLFNLRAIKSAHEKSTHKLSLWNPYQDVPSFKQGLEKEIDLIASIELSNYGKIVTNLISLLFKSIPLILKPATLEGSINKYGENRTIFLIMLENHKALRKSFSRQKRKTQILWKIEKNNITKENLPDLIEEIAYKIYIDLTGSELFKSWDCFQLYTLGLQKYLLYTELKREQDYKHAEKLYQQSLSLEPNNPAVCYNAGVMKYYEYQENENEKAIELFRNAVKSSDIQLKARAHCGLANALTQKFHRFGVRNIQLLNEAVCHGEEALRLNPKLDSSHKSLAFACHQLSESLTGTQNKSEQIAIHRKKAIYHYQKAFELNNEHYIAMNNLGNLYLEWAKNEPTQKVNLLNKAIKKFEKSLIINAFYHHAYDNLGNAFMELGKYEEAREAFMNAILYQPNYAEAKNDLAILFMNPAYKGHDIESAQKYYLEAVESAQSESHKEKLKLRFEVFKRKFSANTTA